MSKARKPYGTRDVEGVGSENYPKTVADTRNDLLVAKMQKKVFEGQSTCSPLPVRNFAFSLHLLIKKHEQKQAHELYKQYY